jgi:hypothetical protein
MVVHRDLAGTPPAVTVDLHPSEILGYRIESVWRSTSRA